MWTEGRLCVGSGFEDDAEYGGVGCEWDGAGDADGGSGRAAGGEDCRGDWDEGIRYCVG
jgi:hypothetical protein